MSIYSIYKVTNTVNGKCYIGFSSNASRRMSAHKASYMAEHKQLPKLYSAMAKYGIDKFTFDVIYESPEYEHTLNVMEPFFIRLNDSIDNGYNILKGGGGDHRPLTEEQKRIRKQNMKPYPKRKGRPLTVEQKARRKELLSKYVPPMKGRKASDETRRLQSEVHKSRFKTNPFKFWKIKTPESIKQMVEKIAKTYLITCPDGSEQIAKNLKDYCRNNGLNPAGMWRVQTGQQDSYKGYRCQRVVE